MLPLLCVSLLGSKNCMIELRAAIKFGKPIVALMDPDPSKGYTMEQAIDKLTRTTIHLTPDLVPELALLKADQPVSVVEWKVKAGDYVSKGDVLCYITWNFAEQGAKGDGQDSQKVAVMSSSEGTMLTTVSGSEPAFSFALPMSVKVNQALLDLHSPEGEKLAQALFQFEPVEWSRLGIFQNVSLRLIATHLLPHAKGKQPAMTASIEATVADMPPSSSMVEDGIRSRVSTGRAVYIANELSHKRRNTVILEPIRGKRHHMYVSEHNKGAEDLLLEINQFLGSKEVSDRSSEMYQSRRMRKQIQFASGLNISKKALSWVRSQSQTRREFASGRGQVRYTTNIDELVHCDAMLVYLNANTWTSK